MYKSYILCIAASLMANLLCSCGKTNLHQADGANDTLKMETDPYSEAMDDGYGFIYEKISGAVSSKVLKTLPLQTENGLFVSVFEGKSRNTGMMDSGFAVWKKAGENKEMLWFADGFKDKMPHSFSMADINLDGLSDIVCYIGEEKTIGTLFYLGSEKLESFSLLNFKQVLRSQYAYASVLDLDHDGNPEILNLMSNENNLLIEMEKRIPKMLIGELNAIYHKAAKGFEKTHYTYDHSGLPPYLNLFITEPFSILKLENGEFVERTETYIAHLDWRKGIIERLMDGATEKEKESLAFLISEIDAFFVKSQ